MKNSISYLVFVFGMFFLGSCGVTHVNSTLIIGKWKNINVLPISSAQNAKDASFVAENIDSGDAKNGNDIKDSGKEFSEKLSNVQSEFPEVKSALEFKNDYTATYTFKDRSVQGIWKIDRQGKTVTFTSSEIPGKIIFKITRIDSQRLQSIESFPQGKVRINYLKQI
jgi:hypothetical protein